MGSSQPDVPDFAICADTFDFDPVVAKEKPYLPEPAQPGAPPVNPYSFLVYALRMCREHCQTAIHDDGSYEAALVKIGLVEEVNGGYMLTALGNLVLDLLLEPVNDVVQGSSEERRVRITKAVLDSLRYNTTNRVSGLLANHSVDARPNEGTLDTTEKVQAYVDRNQDELNKAVEAEKEAQARFWEEARTLRVG